MSQSQSTAIQKHDKDRILEQVISKGDLADLTPADRVSYYNAVCVSLGLNPLTKPFDFIKIKEKVEENGKEIFKDVIKLYARKDATEQLRKINGISIWKIENTIEDGCLIVTAYARTPDGREDIDEGIVYIKGKVGDNLANLQMKAITKAKRRVTLSICGLGFLDESEIDSIPNAHPLPDPAQDAVMTEAEQESLTLSHQASGLDKWACGRALAMQVIKVCEALETAGCPEGIWREWLPVGIESRLDLSVEQAQKLVGDFGQRLEVIKQAEITKWNCSPALAVQLIHVYSGLIARGVEKDVIMQKLSKLGPSFRALSDAQATEALKEFNHWLKSYDEATEGKVNNNG